MIRVSFFLVLLMSMNGRSNDFVSQVIYPALNTCIFGIAQAAFRSGYLQEKKPVSAIGFNDILPDLIVGTAAGALYVIGQERVYENAIKPTLQYYGIINNDAVIH